VSISGFYRYNPGTGSENAMATFQWRDDFSKVLGAHSLKFGVQITRSRKDQNNSGANENGTATFNTSAAKTRPQRPRDVLLGNFQTYTEGQVDTWMWARFSQYELTSMDSWRAQPGNSARARLAL
jgi:hypothetical protein